MKGYDPGDGAEGFDVVVLGAGAGGMAAASVAAAGGLRVLVVERTSEVGGTTAISGGMVWVPNNHHLREAGLADSEDAARAYLDATVADPAGRDLRDAYLAEAPRAIDHLERTTALRLQPVAVYPDYYPAAPGATTGGRVLEPVPFDGAELGDAFARLRRPLDAMTLLGGMMVARQDIPHFRKVFRSARSTGRVVALVGRYALQRLRHPRGTHLVLGNALAGRLLKSLIDLQVPILTDTEARGLLVEDGRIAGVRIGNGQAESSIRARLGVVLATGGFSHDPERRRACLPLEAADVSATAPGARGDGIRLGLAAGATFETGNANNAFWTPASVLEAADGRRVVFPHTVTDRSKPGVIAVDASGQRFTNEARSYQEFVLAMFRAHRERPSIPAYLVCDRRFLWTYGLGAVRPFSLRLAPYRAAGYLAEGRSLEDLANRLGIDARGLATTVAAYNAEAVHGRDPAFGRGGDAYQRHLGDADHRPNPCVAPIATPPFYAVALVPADLGTAAGLRTNAEAQVLDDGGRPIPGLYAAGNDMNSIMRGSYPGPGITLGPALTFGYLAAAHMLAAAGRPVAADREGG
ncbi:MAG TPA: FAD-dependent oxidoreductase [Geminicoccaceae bacterium]